MRRWLILLLVFAGMGASAHAQTSKLRRYRAVSESVALQPFTFDQPRPARRAMAVAYYAPRAIPRARSTSADDDVNDQDFSERIGPVPGSDARPMINGNRAVLRNGVAYAPSNAPDRVKSAIWAVNTIRRKPYVWGGGHGSFNDRGYDCSGTVSFALHHAGLLGSPLPSNDLMRYGERGRGRWFTVYSRRGHTFAVIAGLRLDTTDFGYGGNVGPRWHNDFRDTRGFVATHPVGL